MPALASHLANSIITNMQHRILDSDVGAAYGRCGHGVCLARRLHHPPCVAIRFEPNQIVSSCPNSHMPCLCLH